MIPNTNLKLAWLYPKTMNLYGDRGNIIALSYRCAKRSINLEIIKINIGDKFDAQEADLAFFGGGQDRQQLEVAKDLQDKKNEIYKFYQSNKPMLAICGGYQLLGDYFITYDKKKIAGINIFKLITIGGNKRMIGNVVIECPLLNNEKIVGFENHSGRTYLENENQAFGEVLKGYGNNGEDKTEGVISNNFIGTYLHGPLLPKNPVLTDWLIVKALEIKYGKIIKLEKLNNSLENKARENILNKIM